MLEVFNGGGVLGTLNHTNIVLVHKIDVALSINDFTPIYLCNVLYKLIAKVSANRLKNVLPHIISSFQSTFVLGRPIIDIVMVAYELLHSMKARQKGRDESVALKFDISKAYDKIERKFLKSIMWRLGFSVKWIQLVIECVESITYSLW